MKWTIDMARKKKRAWWLDDDPYSDRFYKYRKNNEKAFFKVTLCESCKRAHEETYQDGAGMVTAYYLDFPTYGLKRKTCKECSK